MVCGGVASCAGGVAAGVACGWVVAPYLFFFLPFSLGGVCRWWCAVVVAAYLFFRWLGAAAAAAVPLFRSVVVWFVHRI